GRAMPSPRRKRGVPADLTRITFSGLQLSAPIQRALDDAGYVDPTPIQGLAIPAALDKKDVLGIAQTGTGKTAAFALPIIEALLKSDRPRGPKPEFDPDRKPEKKIGHRNSRRGKRPPAFLPRALVLSPTRELATQIMDSFAEYARHTELRQIAIFGGVKQFGQERDLERGTDIIVATPGRLQDLMNQGLINLTKIETFVLDEADRMLDMGFIQPIREIGEALPGKRQSLLFSATMPPAIAKLAAALLRDPVHVEVPMDPSNLPKIKQSVHAVNQEDKHALLESLLGRAGVERAVVFIKTKHGADRLCKKLVAADIGAVSIHGNKTQAQRNRALDTFRSGRSRVLVATDVAARGLDVDGVTHVFNYDLPREPEAYVHRIGRTGRAGATGVAIAFCSPQERGFLRAIEREIGEKIPPAQTSQSGQRPAKSSRAKPETASRGVPSGNPTRPSHSNPGSKPAPKPYWYADARKQRKQKQGSDANGAASRKQAKKKGYPIREAEGEPTRGGRRTPTAKGSRAAGTNAPARPKRKPLHRGKGVTPRY
ncbi:MAG: DEAD/DEAH box helicase, partial [Planctomycetota bacterium]